MSEDQDDTLLDEDLGDEEYDLGNDEEEALLADDYEIDRQNSYKGEEETDDVLDLGVTDALDDLEGEDDNVEYRNETDGQTHCYPNDDNHVDNHGNYYDKHHHHHHQLHHHHHHHSSYEEHGHDIEMQQSTIIRGDLREKLQKNVQRHNVGNGQIIMDEDDCDDAREKRNRFQAERVMISPKMNNDIPDSLESVVTAEQLRPTAAALSSFRGRGRGRGIRGIRGGRYLQNMGNFHNHRFMGRGSSMFEDQKQQYRPPPMLEPRPPPMFQNVSSNHMNPQMIYHQENQFQHFPQGVPALRGGGGGGGPRPPFEEPRQFNQNQFPGGNTTHPLRPQNPQMEYRPPRGPIPAGTIPRFNGPPNSGFMQNQNFHRSHQLEQEIPGRQMMPPACPMIQPGPPMPSNQQGPPPPAPMHQPQPQLGMPLAQSEGQSSMPAFRSPGQNQIIHQSPHLHQNAPGFGPQFQAPQPPPSPYEGRNIYDGRPPYGNQPPSVNQFSNSSSQLHGLHQQQHQLSQNVSIPQGHKILINPHFRGNVQPQNDGRIAWDNSQQTPQVIHSQGPNDRFGQNPSTTYSGQPPSYNPPSGSQEGSQNYQKNYLQNKNDDPYAYFSDVWQENRTKPPRASSPSKNYSGDRSYSRDNSLSKDYDKYKSDSRDSYLDDQRYRDKSPSPRTRDPPRSRPPPQSNNYHNDSYDQRQSSRLGNSSSRPLARAPTKRTPEPQERTNRDISPKRTRLNRDSQENRRAAAAAAVTTTASNPHHDNEAEMDPEEREYRKKMEDQKRLREKILQEKENRRKQAALEKQSDESKDSKNFDHVQQENKPAVAAVVLSKDFTENTNVKLRIRTGAGQATELEKSTNLRIVRAVPAVKKSTSSENHNAKNSGLQQQEVQKIPMQISSRRIVIQQKQQLPNARIATTIQKTVSNLQKSQATNAGNNFQQKASTTDAIAKKVALALQKNPAGVRGIAGDRTGSLRKIVVHDTATATTGDNIKKVIASVQSNNRVVLQKPIHVKRTPVDSKSNTILIENLAMSTTEAQIRRMCQGIGTLESIVMGEGGTATVIFKTHSAAMVFHKKYQRKTIDSSTINIKFLSQTGNSQQLVKSS